MRNTIKKYQAWYHLGKAKKFMKLSEHWLHKGKIRLYNDALDKAKKECIRMADLMKEIRFN